MYYRDMFLFSHVEWLRGLSFRKWDGPFGHRE